MATINSDADYQHALQILKKNLDEEQLGSIQRSTNPAELAARAQQVGNELGQMPNAPAALQALGRNGAILLEPFDKLMEGLSKLSADGGNLIWGCVFYILEISKKNVQTLEEVLNFCQNIADEMAGLARLDQEGTRALYVAILHFWVAAVEHYDKKFRGWHKTL
ncbi:hypothetical protein H0H92_015888 [Tricholoma furcatifolium]|nr:hypothetical protein H0H92_015888 [Tricholoma furcatifolium]